ncbi:hypothetical protein EOD41_08640 [Mucilaginibacter limnophilus]|uniref:Outer membrane protein beta-barrel domain-containing protein n=1 Tax=Mucilaginibacter limnophilus TaxID=1932778 RepID=A0A3S2Y2L4_9SPHI|nr:hypothetical protein [Mucilaginibacter limnophilus]RVU02008.1 hypothetical protein EOD41_08640 [Mucilaginibacter limnophilus]
MNHHFNKQPFLLCLIILLFCFEKARAQTPEIEFEPVDGYNEFNKGHGIAIVAEYGYDIPQGALGLNYKLTPTYGLGVLKKIDAFTVNFNLNYHEYPVKNNSYGKVDNYFLVLGFYTGGAYDKMISSFFKVYGGLNVGGWFKRYDIVTDYDDCDCEQGNINFYFAPKAGFTYLTNSNIGIGIEAKYNIFVTGYDYVTDEPGGKLYNSIAASVMLSYHF